MEILEHEMTKTRGDGLIDFTTSKVKIMKREKIIKSSKTEYSMEAIMSTDVY